MATVYLQGAAVDVFVDERCQASAGGAFRRQQLRPTTDNIDSAYNGVQ